MTEIDREKLEIYLGEHADKALALATDRSKEKSFRLECVLEATIYALIAADLKNGVFDKA